jgi:hypothetical protein
VLAKILNKNNNKKLNIIDIGCYIGHFSNILNREFKSFNGNFFQSSRSSLNKITVNDNLWNFSRRIFSLNLFKKNYSKLKVQCQTLDNFVKEHHIKKIDLLKFDTEGNELNILKGARKALKNTKVVYFEILSKKSFFFNKFKKINSILLNNNFFLYKKKRIKTVSFLSNLIAYDLIYLKCDNYKPTI